MERIAMSQEERDWLSWLKRAKDGMITQRYAAEQMGVTERWVRKLLVQMDQQGMELWCMGCAGGPLTEGSRRGTAKVNTFGLQTLCLLE